MESDDDRSTVVLSDVCVAMVPRQPRGPVRESIPAPCPRLRGRRPSPSPGGPGMLDILDMARTQKAEFCVGDKSAQSSQCLDLPSAMLPTVLRAHH